jgi:hypothetical protein
MAPSWDLPVTAMKKQGVAITACIANSTSIPFSFLNIPILDIYVFGYPRSYIGAHAQSHR